MKVSVKEQAPQEIWLYLWLFLAALSGSLIWAIWKSFVGSPPPISLSLGIAVAGLVLFGLRVWPPLAAGALLGAALVEPARPVLQSFAHGGGLTLGAVITGSIILRRSIRADALLEPRTIVWILIAVATGTLTGAATATGGAMMAGAAGAFSTGFIERFARFGLGLVLATPLVLVWASPHNPRWKPRIWLSFCALMAAIATFALAINLSPPQLPVAWAVFPPLIFAALFFGMRGATLSIAIVAIATLSGVHVHLGPLSLAPDGGLRLAQLYVASIAATTLLLAAISDKSLEMALRERAEQRYRAIFECSGVGVSVLSLDGRYLEINDRNLEITGYSREELLDEPVSFVAPVAENNHDANTLQRLANGELSHASRDLKIRTKNGQARWVRATSTLVRDADGRPDHIVSVAEDISDRVNAEHALADSENRLRLAQELTGVGVWEVDLSTRTSKHSLASAALLGVPWHSGQYHPHDFLASLGELQLDALRQHLRHAAKARSSFDLSVRVSPQDGSTRWVRLYGSYDPSDEQSRLLGLAVDITRDVEASAKLREAHEKLLRVARLSAMGAMASTLAHELNQPLAAITNFVEAGRFQLRRGPADAAVLLEMLDAARDQALRAGRIVQKMRAFAISGEVAMERVALAPLIDAVCTTIGKLKLADGVTIECAPPLPGVHILCDPMQIEQVLANLVKNAVEATAASSQRLVHVATEELDHSVEISVRDTGSGLSTTMLDTLFEPFRTSKDEGMGLGLSICQTIVDAHGGKLWAENNRASGATFHLILPLDRDPFAEDQHQPGSPVKGE